jgi:hypothetical protein
MAAVLTLAQTKQIRINIHKRNNIKRLRFKLGTAENFQIFSRAHDGLLLPDSLNIL